MIPEFIDIVGHTYEVVIVPDIRGDYGELVEARVLRGARRIIINGTLAPYHREAVLRNVVRHLAPAAFPLTSYLLT